MSNSHSVRELVSSTRKGITPKYVEFSDIVVLNQRCIRDNKIDYINARFHDPSKKFSKDKVVRVGDILINSTGVGTAGRCAFVRELPDSGTVITDSHVLIVRVKDYYTAGCLEYSLFSIQDKLQTFMDGSTGQGEFDKQILFNIVTGLPEYDKRKTVYDLLNSFDKKIELNNKINAELEAMAKTLYDYWFVQFDFPDVNGKPYKSSGGKMVYNEVLKREIPEGWKDCELGEHIEFQRGISYKSTDIKDDGVPFINLNSFLLTGQFKLSGTKYFNGNFKQESKLNVGDLVIAITDVTRNADITGKAFVIPDVFKEEPLISCDVAAVSSETFTVGYLEQLFNSDSYHAYIKNYATGTLVLHLNLDGVNWFKTTLPPMTLLNRYEDYCKSLFKQRNITLKENIQLEKLRDWLLPMLMNGQVKVK